MGLFDNKQTKEEKKIYERLLSIKNDSYALKISLPKDAKSFLSSPKKEELITKYKLATQIMDDVQLIQDLNIKNLGGCYDFVDRQYNKLGVRNGVSMSTEVFMGHIRLVASEKKMENVAKTALNQAQKQYNETLDNKENFVLDIQGRLSQMNNAPGHTRAMDAASDMARELANDLGLSNNKLDNTVVFNNKFPHYCNFFDYIIYGKKDPKQPEFYEIIDKCIYLLLQKDEVFDLLIPYVLEKQHMGIKLNEKELEIAKIANEKIISNQNYNQLNFYIRMNYIMFNKSNIQLDEFLDLFEQCNKEYLIPAGLKAASNIDNSQGYNSGRSGR